MFFSRKSEVINKTDKYKLKPAVLTVVVMVAVALVLLRAASGYAISSEKSFWKNKMLESAAASAAVGTAAAVAAAAVAAAN